MEGKRMKWKILIAVLVISAGMFLVYRIGYVQGYNYSIPAMQAAVDSKLISRNALVPDHWLNTARTRLFGKYYIFKPADTNSAALWVCTGQAPYHALAMLEDDKSTGRADYLCLSDKFQDSVSVEDADADGHFENLTLFKGNSVFYDYDMDGAWDLRSDSEQSQKLEVRIGAEWFELTQKGGKHFIKSENGFREVTRDKGSYHLVEKEKTNQ